MSKRIQIAVVHFVNQFPGPDIHRDIECVNYYEDFIEIISKNSDFSSTYPTFNVLKVAQYSEEID